MTVSVLFFAFARDRVGADRLDIEVEAGSTVADVFRRFADQLGASMTQWMFAVNDEWAPADRVLQAGDQVALIPPVSGG